MSAYVMQDDEINIIVSYFITPLHDDRLWTSINGEYGYMDVEMARKVAKILMDENVKSVNYRYDESEPSTYEFEYIPQAQYRPIGNIAGALDCLEYQSSETDDFKESNAWAIICDMRKALLKKADVANYTWGIE